MKPGKPFKIVLIIILIAAAAVLAGIGIYAGRLYSKLNKVTVSEPRERIPRSEETFEVNTDEPDTIEVEEVEELFDVDSIDMMESDSIKNILLIGQDAREGEERQRSDTMIICSINTHTKKVTLASLMRDMYVPIPGYSNNRINAAYAFGGMELLDEVIEQDFGIPIDGNVEVDFEGFVEAMDVIGGIEIELSGEEAGYISTGGWEDQGEYGNDGTWNLQEGMNTLTPAQALSFARIRHVGNSDWERTDRQRRVIMAAFNKISSSSTAKQLSIADSILPYITTDLSGRELLSYVKTISEAGIKNFESYRIPADGTYSSENISGMSVLVPDLVKNSELLKEYLYGKDGEPEIKDKDDEEGEETEKDLDDKTGTKTTAAKNKSKAKNKDAGNTASGGSGTGNTNTNANTYVADNYDYANYGGGTVQQTAPADTGTADNDGNNGQAPAEVTDPNAGQNILIDDGEAPADGGSGTSPADAGGNAGGTDPNAGGTDAGQAAPADNGGATDTVPADTGAGGGTDAAPAADVPAAEPAPAAEVPAAPEPVAVAVVPAAPSPA